VPLLQVRNMESLLVLRKIRGFSRIVRGVGVGMHTLRVLLVRFLANALLCPYYRCVLGFIEGFRGYQRV